MSDIQDFYNGYEDAKMGGGVPAGQYEFEITENLGTPEWFESVNGRQCVECTTSVVGGPYDGEYGPRIRFQTGGFTYNVKDKSGEQVYDDRGQPKTRTVEDETILERLKGQVRTIHGANPPQITNAERMCDQIADACVGDHFIANLVEKGTFTNFGKMWALSDPPEGFVSASRAADFTT